MNTLNFKIVGTVIFALLLAIGIVLYVNAGENENENETNRSAPLTWYFNGTDPLDENHYTLNPVPCSGLAETICTIEANNNGGVPELGAAQLQDIQDALDSLEDDPMPNATVKSFRSQ